MHHLWGQWNNPISHISPYINEGFRPVRDDQLALALQILEEDEVQNMEKNYQAIMSYGELAIMMQHQEEYESQEYMDK